MSQRISRRSISRRLHRERASTGDRQESRSSARTAALRPYLQRQIQQHAALIAVPPRSCRLTTLQMQWLRAELFRLRSLRKRLHSFSRAGSRESSLHRMQLRSHARQGTSAASICRSGHTILRRHRLTM